MAQTRIDPFPAADLESNRAGRLTPDQRKGFGNLERGIRKDRVMLGLIMGVISALIFTSNGPTTNALERPAFGAVFAALAVALVAYGLVITDSLTRDLRAGAVQSVEGAIGKHTDYSHGSHSSITWYYLEVGGRNWEVGSLTYDAAPDVGWVRLYFLPRSHKVVNLERLPDRMPAGMPATAFPSPEAASQLVGTLAAAWRSHDTVAINEARAQGEAMKNAMDEQMARAAVPPPPALREATPLEQAILGSWAMGPVSMTFMPDGTVVATLPNGRRQNGKWSIGADGKLHSTATGWEQVADAWVAGDTLTIAEDGRGLPFHRVTPS